MNALLQGDYGIAPTSFQTVLLAMLLAFLMGQLIAWVYMFTHSGVSYSRSFVVSLILMPVIVALVLTVLSNNLVTAFGLMAVFAIVRFRNILRDTLDTSYVLAVIVLGMACGTQKFSTAIVGTLVVVAVTLYLWATSFGSRHRYDLILNLHWSRAVSELPALERLLDRHSFKTQCANRHFDSEAVGTDVSYRLLLRDPARVSDLLRDLAMLPGVDQVSSMKAEEESEI
ncbi:DUF4956 domain-containing protein [Horticoccus sp. 23ND18S-11]|uniref:DUF4956 domain-containing protein n=1 Tax=Horticoccus sp. 23ND18S-11 TaxID=3391832 RepID=UPI0039C9949B